MAGTVFSSPVDWERENKTGAERLVHWLSTRGHQIAKPDELIADLLNEGRRRRALAKRERIEYRLAEVLHQALVAHTINLSEAELKQAVLVYIEPELSVTSPSVDSHRVLTRLKKEGYELLLLSNTPTPEFVTVSLGEFGFGNLFGGTIISAEVGYRKPHQKFIQAVRDLRSFNPARAVMIGDRLFDDIKTAQALGIPGVLFSFREHPDNKRYRASILPDAEVDNFTDLYTVIKELV